MKAYLKKTSLLLALLLSLSVILSPLQTLIALEPDKPSRLTPEEVRAELALTRGQRIPEEEFDLYSKVSQTETAPIPSPPTAIPSNTWMKKARSGISPSS